MTCDGQAVLRAGRENRSGRTGGRWGGRVAVLASASLAVLTLASAPAKAACNVNGSTTTCTGNNSGGIGTNTANVVINSLTANLTPTAPYSAIWMENATSVNINLGAYSANSIGGPAIGSNTPDLDLTAVVTGNINATGPNGANSSAVGILIDKFNQTGPGTFGSGSIVNLTHTGNIVINASRPSGSSVFPHMGISVRGGPVADGRATVTHTGNITVNSTGVAGQGAIGITAAAGGGATLVNNGDVSVTAESGSVTGLGAGAPATGNVSVTNTGNISVLTHDALLWGINANAAQGSVTVNHTGAINVTGVSTNGGFAGGQAISVGGRDVVVNSTGNLATSGTALGAGILVTGPVVVLTENPLTIQLVPSNKARVASVGNITTTGADASPGIAVSSKDGVVTSNGTIETNGAASAGIVVGGLYNFDPGNGVMPSNHGPAGSIGVINNTGNVTTRGDTSVGLLATADTSTINSTGNIATFGDNSPAIAALGKVITINGSGNLSTAIDETSALVVAGRISNPNEYDELDEEADSASVTWSGNITTAMEDSHGIQIIAKSTMLNFTGDITAMGVDVAEEEASRGIFVGGTGGATVFVSGNVTSAGDGIAISTLKGGNITVAAGSEIYSRYQAAISISDDVLDALGVPTSDAAFTVVNRGKLSGGALDLTGFALPSGVPVSVGQRGVSYASYAGWTGPEELVNFGVMDGGVAMNWDDDTGIRAGSPGRFVNAPGGVFSGDFAFAPVLVNAGMVSPGGDAAVGTMYVVGGFSQISGVPITAGPANGLAANGQYVVNVDFATMTADRIAVTGGAGLGGEVVIAPLNFNPQTLQPGSSTMRILDATGGVMDLGLDVADSLLVDYGLNFSANAVDLTADVDFTPEGLDERSVEITNTLGQLALAGGGSDPFVSELLGSLLTAGSAAEVESIVRQLSPDALEAQGGQAAPGVALLAGGMFSCGEREGDFRFAAEGQCGWMRIGTRIFNHEGSSDTPAFDENATNLMGGVQKAVSENWRIGFSAGIEQSDVTVPGLARSAADRYQFGAVAKGQYGPIGTYAAVTAGWASGETDRYVPVVAGVAHSEQDTTFYGLHGRLSYTYMLGEDWYLRPQARLDAVHVSVDAFDETGIGGLGLSVAARDDWAVSFSPSVEIGGESDSDGMLFRPWVRGGLTVFDDAESTTMANFVGAPATVAPFVTRTVGDDLFADIGVGLNVLTQDYEFRLSYEGRISDRTDAHDLAVKFIRRF